MSIVSVKGDFDQEYQSKNSVRSLHICESRSKSWRVCVTFVQKGHWKRGRDFHRYTKLSKLVLFWFHGSSFKGFLLFFLFSDWLTSSHLKSRIERGFLDILSRHICNAVTATIPVTNYATSFGAKVCSENQV